MTEITSVGNLPVPQPEEGPAVDLVAQPLAATLAEFVETYPTEDHLPGEVYPLTLTNPISGQAWTILLQPGQVTWLETLIRKEMVTSREAHPDGTGECGHCGALPEHQLDPLEEENAPEWWDPNNVVLTGDYEEGMA
ncbi:hypothetical protein [Microbispora sp. NBRC 16548]|uniref:hypothetical protein n=1 Tax=Microbispora sp. NBRC 16548 TaxID=3030994 RepID=UPI00161AA02A|nr:hypothetical protein [Microbispora sp. NBRC 16548]GLX06755.1 hypothetical protein Misp03_36820 [Microbispora sp. NBRC 16548]